MSEENVEIVQAGHLGPCQTDLDGQITPHRSISAGCFRWYFVGS